MNLLAAVRELDDLRALRIDRLERLIGVDGVLLAVGVGVALDAVEELDLLVSVAEVELDLRRAELVDLVSSRRRSRRAGSSGWCRARRSSRRSCRRGRSA